MKEKKKSVFAKYVPYMGRKKTYMPIALVLSGTSAVISILPFYYVWKITREIFGGQLGISFENITLYAKNTFLFSLLGILFYFIALVVTHIAAFEVEIGIKKAGFKKSMNKPLGFFNTNSSGKIRKIINDGAASSHGFLAHQLPDIAGSIITPILLLIMLFVFDWRLGVACLIPILLSFFVMTRMMTKEGKSFQRRYMDALEDMGSECVEYVRAIPVVKTFGQSVKSFTRFYNSIENYKELIVAYNKMWIKPFSLYMVLVEATAFFLVPMAVLLIGRGNELGTVISDFVLYFLIAPSFGSIIIKSATFSHEKNIANEAIDRFNELFDYSEIDYPEVGEEFTSPDIEFKDVVFMYDGDKNTLNGINLKIEKGETLALVGKSGSGKTTIARLVARFWDVNSGEIKIGGQNIKAYSKETLMDNIAFVFQNNQLFKASLLENITFGNENITEKQIEEALIKSRAKEIIDGLENGLDTVVGEGGTYLSGGEMQRIALARAFLKDAPIVLLDEATAFADPENEHLIQGALLELSKGKTTIMIAHRMTSIKYADNIAVVDEGKISQYGTHEELVIKDGLYKKMWDEYQKAVSWNIKRGTT